MIINVEPLRTVNISGSLGDIESHLPPNHPYKDTDRVTWGHEGTHGVNSRIRNSLDSRSNAFYVLDNKAFTAEEPDFKLSDLANTIPQNLRGKVYKMYLIDQQRYWNNEPLYVLDELSAYCNGSQVGIDELVGHDRIEYSLSRAVEFFGYGLILHKNIGDDRISDFLSHTNIFLISKFNEFPTIADEYNKLRDYMPLWY